MTRFAFVFCTLGFVYINLFIVISDITIPHDMVRRSPEPLGRRMDTSPFSTLPSPVPLVTVSFRIHTSIVDILTGHRLLDTAA